MVLLVFIKIKMLGLTDLNVLPPHGDWVVESCSVEAMNVTMAQTNKIVSVFRSLTLRNSKLSAYIMKIKWLHVK